MMNGWVGLIRTEGGKYIYTNTEFTTEVKMKFCQSQKYNIFSADSLDVNKNISITVWRLEI